MFIINIVGLQKEEGTLKLSTASFWRSIRPTKKWDLFILDFTISGSLWTRIHHVMFGGEAEAERGSA